MKQKKFIIIFAVTACLVGFLLWWFSTTQVLIRRSADLIDCVRMQEGTGRIERAFKGENLRDLIDDSVTLVYPEMETTFKHAYASNEPIVLGEDRAKSALIYLTELAEWITVTEESIKVLDTTDDTGQVDVSFKLAAKLKGKPVQEAEMKGVFTFTYSNNRWLLSEARFQ